MKLLISTLVALGCLSANAALTKPIKITKVKLGSVLPKSTTDGYAYFGPVAVGRISPVNFTVELVGLTVTDYVNYPTPIATTRKVKTVLSFAPADPMDPAQVTAAWDAIAHFYSVKTGKQSCPGGGCDPEVVSKLTGIIYTPANLGVNNDACMGLDLEVLDPTPATSKACYIITPDDVIEYAP